MTRSDRPFSLSPVVKAYAPLVAWAAVLFALSSIPSSALPRAAEIVGLDKVTHFSLYAVFGALSARGQVRRASGLPDRSKGASLTVVVVMATLSALAFGITDEIHQIFVPGRSADWHDGLADTVGGLAGGLVGWLFFTRRSRPARATAETGQTTNDRATE